MADRSSKLLAKAPQDDQSPIANTIALRRKYELAQVKQQTEGEGDPLPSFAEWAKENYPELKILK
jgi:hypothetical protein